MLLAAGAGCRGPSPRQDLDQGAKSRRVRVARAGEALLPSAGVRWEVASRDEIGAWAWPQGRIEISRLLLDRLDDNELAAALAHELGHLIDGGHLHAAPSALAGDAGDLERRADRIACGLLRSRGVPGAALTRMLGKLAAATGDRNGALAARIAAAPAECSPVAASR